MKDLSEHMTNKIKAGTNALVNQNNANTDENDGTILHRLTGQGPEGLDQSKDPIKIVPPYILVPSSQAGQTDCNSLRLCTKLDIIMESIDEKCATENSAAVAVLDQALSNANFRKHEGVIRGQVYNNTPNTGEHVHEPRAYYHPDLQEYIAKGEAGFYQGCLRKLRDDE